MSSSMVILYLEVYVVKLRGGTYMSVATATKPKKKRKIITRKMREQQKPSDNLIDLNEYRKGVKKKPKNV